MKLANRVKTVKPSITLAVTAKAKSMKKRGIDVINFAAGEPDFDTPSFIKEAAKAAIDKGKTKYTPSIGTLGLRKAISAELKRTQQLIYKPEEIIVSNGAKHSLYNIFQAICNKDDEIIIPSPYWVSYPEMVRLAEAKPVIVKSKQKEGFRPPIELLKSAITKKTKALILNSPNNPTGSVYDIDYLRNLAKIAVKNNILIISDEIYKRLIYDGKKHISVAFLGAKIKKLTVVVDGVSKTYSMTGWRIGYLASNTPELLNAIKRIQSHSTSNPSSISQEAALCALTLKKGNSSIKKMASEFEKRRNYMADRINRIDGLYCNKPEGAFYCFCDISKTRMDSVSFVNKLLDKEKVAAIPGEAFGCLTHIRLSFATSMKDIKEGINRLERFVSWARQ